MTDLDVILAALGSGALFLGLVGGAVQLLDVAVQRRATRRAARRLGLLCVAAALLGIPAPIRADCGEERAAVKLGTDAEARTVALLPAPVTIAELVLRPAPHPLPADRRAADERGTERTVYTVHATITGYKLESDGDLHVVIADEHGVTMIVEIPTAECAKPGAWGDRVATARDAFLRMLVSRGLPRPAAKLHRAAVPAAITGVGFFDRLHGQTGAARNGIELHPVIAIEGGGGS